MVFARDGHPFVLLDGEAIAERGNIAWVSLKEGFAVFNDDDGKSISIIQDATLDSGQPVPVGTECRNETYEAVFEARNGATIN